MHMNPAFRRWPEEEARGFVEARGFGVLTAAGPDGPLASHIPFVLAEDGAAVEFHLLRSNPLVRVLGKEATPALIAVSGADAYISPDWYGVGPDQVPTWNYVAVHLRGAARLLPDAALRPHLERLSAQFENRLAPKPPWTLDKTSPGYFEKLARGIVPAALAIEKVESTLKLGQNKPPEARAGAANGVEAARIGSAGAFEISALMRALDAPEE